MMNELPKSLREDPDGMTTYDYLVNHIGRIAADLSPYIENINQVDASGQFLASTARFLAAIDKSFFSKDIAKLVEYAIDRDRDRRFVGSLLQAIWGEDYQEHAEELCQTDNNFRRLHKRIYAKGI